MNQKLKKADSSGNFQSFLSQEEIYYLHYQNNAYRCSRMLSGIIGESHALLDMRECSMGLIKENNLQHVPSSRTFLE